MTLKTHEIPTVVMLVDNSLSKEKDISINTIYNSTNSGIVEVFTDFSKYESLVRQAFSQRRKTLKNTLKNTCSIQQIEQAGLAPGQRAEELSIEDFVKLYHSLN